MRQRVMIAMVAAWYCRRVLDRVDESITRTHVTDSGRPDPSALSYGQTTASRPLRSLLRTTRGVITRPADATSPVMLVYLLQSALWWCGAVPRAAASVYTGCLVSCRSYACNDRLSGSPLIDVLPIALCDQSPGRKLHASHRRAYVVVYPPLPLLSSGMSPAPGRHQAEAAGCLSFRQAQNKDLSRVFTCSALWRTFISPGFTVVDRARLICW